MAAKDREIDVETIEAGTDGDAVINRVTHHEYPTEDDRAINAHIWGEGVEGYWGMEIYNNGTVPLKIKSFAVISSQGDELNRLYASLSYRQPPEGNGRARPEYSPLFFFGTNTASDYNRAGNQFEFTDDIAPTIQPKESIYVSLSCSNPGAVDTIKGGINCHLAPADGGGTTI